MNGEFLTGDEQVPTRFASVLLSVGIYDSCICLLIGKTEKGS